jgi:hypothetical protein
LSAFEERIGEYAALHRRLEGPLPPLKSLAPRSILLNRRFLSSAIRAARPDAHQGNIFTPQVERMFRGLVAEALEGKNVEALLRDLFDEHPAMHEFHPGVYDRYPDWASHEMPMFLLHRLPALPEDVEYRLIGHDLVLWDAHADSMLDVLPDAIPRPSS